MENKLTSHQNYSSNSSSHKLKSLYPKSKYLEHWKMISTIKRSTWFLKNVRNQEVIRKTKAKQQKYMDIPLTLLTLTVGTPRQFATLSLRALQRISCGVNMGVPKESYFTSSLSSGGGGELGLPDRLPLKQLRGTLRSTFLRGCVHENFLGVIFRIGDLFSFCVLWEQIVAV